MSAYSVLCLFLFGFVVFLFISVDQAEGGECCKAHYDNGGLRHDTTWCSHYCCHDRRRMYSPLYCCSDFFMRADRSDRLDFCSSWFTASANLWAPVLIAIVIIAILIGCGICCCCIPGFCFCC
ncbi:uncharacterized protein LOC133192598 [Saccostrea echinata]|uniref:uncharacterized protein LOC133192598 n=1 Tax=Saccostrea echinata TaxID=191078 RepID=UPI002A8230E5|nr:uncharacterized protein LOC133192598 [Saccostrea echinata]